MFKDPLSAYRPSFSGSGAFNSRSTQLQGVRGDVLQQQPPNANPLPIAPKPIESRPLILEENSRQPFGSVNPSPAVEQPAFVFPIGTNPHGIESHPSTHPERTMDTIDHSHLPEPQRRLPKDQPVHYDFNALTTPDGRESGDSATYLNPLDWFAAQSSGSKLYTQEIYHPSNRVFPAVNPYNPQYPNNPTWEPVTPSSASSVPSLRSPLEESIASSAQSAPNKVDNWSREIKPHMVPQDSLRIIPVPSAEPEPLLSAESYELIEDAEDPFDVSDEDVDMEEDFLDDKAITTWHGEPQEQHLRNNDLGKALALQVGQEHQGLRMRSFIDFIDRPDMLSAYTPSIQASPLRDPMTARIFCHFINVTAPSISMFERNPANPSLIFQGSPVSKSQQHIWTCKSLSSLILK